jgi:hypothetical protein
MARIKLNLKSMSIPEKIARAQQIVAALTGNPNFTAPHPPLADVTAAIHALETAGNDARAARLEAKRRTSTQGLKEDALDRVLSQLSAHVESVAGDDEALILSAGLQTRAVNAPAPGEAAPPETLTAEAGNHDGEVSLSWATVRGARAYVVEHCLDGAADAAWTHAGVTPRPLMYVEGLHSGARYRFRVAVITLRGQSPWSNHAVKTAP